uniref:Uncharacterized protein ycf33 n=1 Tax=Araucaria cunninghamii TaxID=56994 RepID=A0A0D6QYB3_ARACU
MSSTVVPFWPLRQAPSPLLHTSPLRRWAVQFPRPQRHPHPFSKSSIRKGERESCSTLRSSTPMLRIPHVSREGGEISKEIRKEKEKGDGDKLWVGMIVIGFTVWLMLGSDERALAFGPEGPLVEEFWENMRRYTLYFFTVGTGALYTVLKPIYDLLKNPVSAVLVIVIISGSFYLLYLTLSAMIGLSEFSYEYAS